MWWNDLNTNKSCIVFLNMLVVRQLALVPAIAIEILDYVSLRNNYKNKLTSWIHNSPIVQQSKCKKYKVRIQPPTPQLPNILPQRQTVSNIFSENVLLVVESLDTQNLPVYPRVSHLCMLPSHFLETHNRIFQPLQPKQNSECNELKLVSISWLTLITNC